MIVKTKVEPKINSTKTKKDINKNKVNEKIKSKKHNKEIQKNLKKDKKMNSKKRRILVKENSKKILKGAIVSLNNNKPDIEKNIIELFDVKKVYVSGEVDTLVLEHMDLKLEKGNFIVILGPSGSGKTTLLNLISGLDKSTDGDIFVNGFNLSLMKDTDLTKFRRDNVGFIFQQYNLLNNLTARENAEVGENLAKKKNPDWNIVKIFKTIDMETQINKYPHQMSGGQQQRVSIARALAKNPNILFADEPTGALDEKTGRKVLDILVNINRQFKTTMVLVTHNPNIAEIADVVIHVLNGKIDKYIKNKNPKKSSDIDWT